jgi:hypothetical protein
MSQGNTPLPGRVVSANVSWGKICEKRKELKRENEKEK